MRNSDVEKHRCEQRCTQAFLDFYNGKYGTEVKIVSKPDVLDRESKKYDFYCRNNKREVEMAIEVSTFGGEGKKQWRKELKKRVEQDKSSREIRVELITNLDDPHRMKIELDGIFKDIPEKFSTCNGVLRVVLIDCRTPKDKMHTEDDVHKERWIEGIRLLCREKPQLLTYFDEVYYVGDVDTSTPAVLRLCSVIEKEGYRKLKPD